MISLVFFYLSKQLYLGFLQRKAHFVQGQNDLNYHDWARLTEGWKSSSTILTFLKDLDAVSFS